MDFSNFILARACLTFAQLICLLCVSPTLASPTGSAEVKSSSVRVHANESETQAQAQMFQTIEEAQSSLDNLFPKQLCTVVSSLEIDPFKIVRILPKPARKAIPQCYSPDFGFYNCMLLPTVVIFRDEKGSEPGVTVYFHIDSTFEEKTRQYFGPKFGDFLEAAVPSLIDPNTITELLSQFKSISPPTNENTRGIFFDKAWQWMELRQLLEKAMTNNPSLAAANKSLFDEAKSQIDGLIGQFMDKNLYFRDAPISAELKDAMEASLALGYSSEIVRMKRSINLWQGSQPSEQQKLIGDSVMAALAFDQVTRDAEFASIRQNSFGAVMSNTTSAIILSARTGASFTPLAPFLDLCELTTGRESCLPGGRLLTDGERALTAIGLVVGQGSFLRKFSERATGLLKGRNFGAAIDEVVHISEAGKPGTLPGLAYTGRGTWKSEAGLIYDRGSAEGTRLRHVLQHAFPNPSNPKHTVFVSSSDDTKTKVRETIKLIDEAWTKRGTTLPSNPKAYDVDLGRKIGINGETKIRVVVSSPGSNSITTAYPIP